MEKRQVGDDGFVEMSLPELLEWQGVLARLGIPLQSALEIAVRAKGKGGDLASGLLASGVGAARLVRAMAADLGIAAADHVDAERLIVSEEHALALLRHRGGHVPVKLLERGGQVSFLITPERIRLDLVRQRVRASPALASRLKLVPAAELRRAILHRSSAVLERKAINGLFDRFPQMSARVVAQAWQGIVVGFVLAAVPVGFLLWPFETLTVLHGLATFFFLTCVALRFAALAGGRPRVVRPRLLMPPADAPRFSVLVALYKEADLIPYLLSALDRLVWPRDRLEIKLVCEADDAATLEAIRAHRLPPHIEVVEVPPGQPRTKPKALAYALPLTGGEFVTLYDAEDRPDPMQLVEAWQRFRASGPDLAVVQAPLEISNGRENMIARMFAFEYAALFRGLLPWLSRRRLVLPLGGTSNHFRREALDKVGGWDPFNVTEDADLGMRLARFGYRAETISCRTRESAPTRFEVWLPQRTRWFKGWSQTWLVHMRAPSSLASNLGLGSFLVAQVLFGGMLASVMLHPVLLLTMVMLAVELLSTGPIGPGRSVLLLVDVINIICGYLSFLLLGWQTLDESERRGFWKVVLFTPLYWMMLSVAGWRALWQLWRRPHHWEKTPHEVYADEA